MILKLKLIIGPGGQIEVSLEEHLEGQSSVKSGFLYLDCCIGKILTMENLRKTRIVVVDWCCMCKINGETMVLFLFIVI